MEVSILRTLRSGRVQTTTLEKIVQMTRTSHLLKEYTEQARKFLSAGKKKKYENIKQMQLPAFASAVYLMGGKGRQNLVGLTCLCFIDIDHMKKVDVEECLRKLELDSHVLMASRSLSGKGIHILVPYTLQRKDPIAPMPLDPNKINQLYGNVFSQVAAYYRELLDVAIDQEVRNAERLSVISYDPEAIYNADAEPIEVKE